RIRQPCRRLRCRRRSCKSRRARAESASTSRRRYNDARGSKSADPTEHSTEARVAMKDWLGHPRGLSVLFFTEMWERFSYYGMRSLLILFMVAPTGLALTTARAATIYGFYTMGVYAMAIPGGWLADRFIGHYRAVFAGGVLIML